MMMSRTISKSLFALSISGLLDKTNLFNRREWGEFLGVSEPAISQWVGDKTIPRPDNLYMILDILQQSTDIPEAPLRSFKDMARRNAIEVSPHGKRMLPTVWEYMTRPAFSDLSSKLAKLSTEDQEKFLFEKFTKEDLTEVVADVVTERPSIIFPTAQAAKVAFRAPEMIAEPMAATPVIYCERTNTPATCANWEHTSWKGIMAPRFRLLSEVNATGAEGQAFEWNQVSQYRHLLIVGAPGTGKTTFLRHLAQNAPAARMHGGDMAMLPLYFHLGCLSEIQTDDDFERAYRKLAPPETNPGRTLFLLDGFDEVRPEKRNRLAGVISGFQSRNPETRFVITSRPSPDLATFPEMQLCRMETPSVPRLLAWVRQELSEKLAVGEKWDEAQLTYVSCLKERPDVFRELQNPLLLSHSTQLFVRYSLTANDDVELFQECLRLLLGEWDEKKNIVRSTGAWARPRNLYQWLSGVCYHSLIRQQIEFTSEDVELWAQKFHNDAPVGEVLRLLSESTGIVQPSHKGRWIIAHATFQEYLAARYIVDSSSDATHLVRDWLHAPRVSNVIKFACAITNDASHLLQFALTADWPRQADGMAVLADIIAQQLTAESDLIKHSCKVLTDWLDSSFTGWETTTMDNDEQISSPKWKLAARQTGGNEPPDSQSLLRTLRAVHRARLGPAKTDLSERLKASPSGVVRAVGESLDVEGYLQAQMLPHNGNDVLVAQVLEG
jgi:hypothetical protein